MKYYVGLTIGPIFDTIERATVPAALWFSSYLFSDLSRRMCHGVHTALPGAHIFSPAYPPEPDAPQDGVGLYHDRVLFSVEAEAAEPLQETLDGIVKSCRARTAAGFPEGFDQARIGAFLDQYLQIHFLILPETALDGKNPVLALSDWLDALELMKTFPDSDAEDPFARLFANNDETEEALRRNDRIKQSPLFPTRNCRYLLNSYRHVRSIPEIANAGIDANKKYNDYFAVVDADGDSMGNFLKGLDDEDVARFSAACFRYGVQAAQMIADFGGMPIYAGGDDLLFLAPVLGKLDGEILSVVELCQKIGTLFAETVRAAFLGDSRALPFPTLSFGISVQYEKHPLYEALEQGRRLLEDRAKKWTYKDASGKEVKNNTALELRKHSGQSLRLLIHNPDVDAFARLTKAGMAVGDSQKTNAVLRTALQFRPLLVQLFRKTKEALNSAADLAEKKARFLKIWKNFFDNPGQEISKDYLNTLGGAVFDVLLTERHRLIGERPDLQKPEASRSAEDTALDALEGVLRWANFLEEEKKNKKKQEEEKKAGQ